MAKLYSSEIAVRAAEDGVQIHGGYGFVKDYPAEKFFRDVKLTTIGEGHQRDPAAGHRPSAPCRLTHRLARRRRARRRPRGRSRARFRSSKTRRAAGVELLQARSFAKTGRAYLVGVTGAAGRRQEHAGRSTDGEIRREGQDRRRHRRRSDQSVHRRRGARRSRAHGRALRRRRRVHPQHGDARSLGGLARATGDVALMLDAAGKDVVIIETVGVGQDEVDIARTADVSIVMLVPVPATKSRRSRRASWRSPTSSSSTRPIARAPTGSCRRLRRTRRCSRPRPASGGRRS